MTETSQVCPIWGTPVQKIIKCNGITTVVLSHHAGGNYRIADELLEKNAIEWLDAASRARLTTQLMKMRNQGETTPHVTPEMLKDENLMASKPWQERIDDALLYMVNHTNWPYDIMPCKLAEETSPNDQLPEPEKANQNASMLMAEMEATDIQQVRNALQTMVKKGLIVEQYPQGYTVTIEAYLAAEEMRQKPNGKQCFVAMWLDQSKNRLYDDAIKPAIERAGYEPMRIDRKLGIDGKIDDAIVAEIKKSSLVIADFTQGKDGNRGSVYYEAGFAHALKIPTILTCRKDQIEQSLVAFDVNHYPIRAWTGGNLAQFQEELYQSIIARTT